MGSKYTVPEHEIHARQEHASKPRGKGRRVLSIVVAVALIFSALWANSIALLAPSDKNGYISAAFYSIDALVFRLTRRTVPEVDSSQYRLVDAKRITDRAEEAQLLISGTEFSKSWTLFKSGTVMVFRGPSNFVEVGKYIFRENAICIIEIPLDGFICSYISR